MALQQCYTLPIIMKIIIIAVIVFALGAYYHNQHQGYLECEHKIMADMPSVNMTNFDAYTDRTSACAETFNFFGIN